MLRKFVNLGLVLLGVAAMAACGADDPAPTLADPSATGRELATEFLTILQAGDIEALDEFLAPGFQLQRADGSGATKDEYLQKPASVQQFEIGADVNGVQQGKVLTVRWTVVITEVINGQPGATGEAPRLSTFLWSDGRWRMTSHANFNLPA